MSFTDHIEELRSRLINALIFIGVAVAICLVYQDPLMKIVVRPHAEVMDGIVQDQPKNPHLIEIQKGLDDLEVKLQQSRDNKSTLVLLHQIVKYLQDQDQSRRKGAVKLKVMKYQSGFISYLKVCIIVGLIIGAPFALFQFWGFISAGLYPDEKKYIYFVAPFSLLAFALGVAFGYYVLIPVGLEYLATFASAEIAENFIALDWYINLFFLLTLALGVIYQLPLVMLGLTKIGIFDASQYLEYWRYWIVLSVVMGALLTPPDPVTQVLLAIPMCGLYGLGVFLAYLFPYRELPDVDDEEAWAEHLGLAGEDPPSSRPSTPVDDGTIGAEVPAEPVELPPHLVDKEPSEETGQDASDEPSDKDRSKDWASLPVGVQPPEPSGGAILFGRDDEDKDKKGDETTSPEGEEKTSDEEPTSPEETVDSSQKPPTSPEGSSPGPKPSTEEDSPSPGDSNSSSEGERDDSDPPGPSGPLR